MIMEEIPFKILYGYNIDFYLITLNGAYFSMEGRNNYSLQIGSCSLEQKRSEGRGCPAQTQRLLQDAAFPGRRDFKRKPSEGIPLA